MAPQNSGRSMADPTAPVLDNKQEHEHICRQLGLLLEKPLHKPNELAGEDKNLWRAVTMLFWQARSTLQSILRTQKGKSKLTADGQKRLISHIFALRDQIRQQKVAKPKLGAIGPSPTQGQSCKQDSKLTTYFHVIKKSTPLEAPEPESSNGQVKDPRKDSFMSRYSDETSATEATTLHSTPSLLSDGRSVKRKRLEEDDGATEHAETEELSQAEQQELVSHKIRDMPRTGFGLQEFDNDYDVPFTLSWDLFRVSKTFPPEATDSLKKTTNVEQLKAKLVDLNNKYGNRMHPSTIFEEEDGVPRGLGPTLSARLEVNQELNKEAFFKFIPLAIKYEPSNRIQRRHGWERLLYIDVDLKNSLPGHMHSETPKIMQAFEQWLLSTHRLLRWKWRALYVQKASETRQRNGNFQWRVIMFATQAHGFKHTVVELSQLLLKWLIPANFNFQQPACKAFTRVELALSRTTSAHVFKPEQIKLVDDLRTTTTKCDDKFLDADYRNRHRAVRPHDPSDIMTDGCATISIGAAKLINAKLEISTEPTAYQARIAGSKGMWYVSAGYDTVDPHHLDVWIEIRESQVKVRHHSGPHSHLFSDNLDPLFAKDSSLFSFDIIRYNKSVSSGDIHKDLLQILEDRGVPRNDIIALAEEAMNEETQTMLDAISDPLIYARFLQRHINPNGPLTGDGMLTPHAANRLWSFLHQGGFMPNSVLFVAEEYLRLCAQSRLRTLLDMRIPCGECCSLLGIADPYGVLEEGEVHVRLTGFSYNAASNKYAMVNGRQVLIARDPTLRASDIQKFEAVDHPKLSHLVNLVVFSVKGSMPAAAKLQGGDYDGDNFTVIWASSLVQPFKNAPVLAQKTPAQLGIKKDESRVSDFLLMEREADTGDLRITDRDVTRFLAHAFKFKMQESYLGIVTNEFYAHSWTSRDISSASSLDLIDLHDHLNDEAKNGYTLGYKAWKEFEASIGGQSKTPAWKEALKSLNERLMKAERSTTAADTGKKDLCALILGFKYRAIAKDGMHILDDLLFNNVLKSTQKALKAIQAALEGVHSRDEDLYYAWNAYADTFPNKGDMQTLEATVKKDIQKILVDWPTQFVSPNMISMEKMIAAYEKIEPPATLAHLTIRPAPLAFSHWELLRASILVKSFPMRKYKAVFWLAHKALCFIKSRSVAGKQVTDALAAYIKVKKPKALASERIEREPLDVSMMEECEDVEDDEDDEYGSADFLDTMMEMD